MKILTAITGIALCCSMETFADNPDAKYAEYPTYAGSDLELTVDNSGTHWRLWSPEAEAVKVNIYPSGSNTASIKTIDMTRSTGGTWTASSAEKLYGKYYTFSVKQGGKWLNETPGVWAKAVGTNGHRAAIIDLSATDPEGWATDKGPEIKNINDAVIYEMHHRDFSQHPSSGIVNKGKFLALTEPSTTNATGEATGVDHLKELGVTHVHILPSYDYNSVDEANLQTPQYNWGYDPYNYNAPEGSYSTNPADPATRITEMKEMVKSLHDNGIGVIMDVVYNHTADNDASNFSLTAPGYYYRHRPDGSYSDASGCGNETASERQQMRDYIINSVKYWAKEYHIDGFRFDLMAIHDIETMNQVIAALKEINPNIFVYGEGWTAGDSPLPVDQRALKENVAKMPQIAVFSDDIRDAIKGHYTDAADRGFATGKPGLEETVKIGIVAATDHPQVDYSKGNNSKFAYAAAPTQIINYVSCHDDLMLTDKLRKSMPDATDAERQRAARLAQTIVFTSQGTPFMFAGEEVFRDKKGVHNSYKSPDSINAIDWSLKHDNAEQMDYYKELIKLRKEHPAFRMTTAEQVARHLKFDKTEPGLISYSLIDHANGDAWKEIKLVFNGSESPREVKIPRGNWTIIAEDGKINASGMGTSKGGKMTVAPTSALILARD
ncbi:type I pullulanase [uncultured Duncaniella sp.]|uniref:type I pullulanase n=2 Tax=uncultured Duncaniella sp. TaxID=2768039 RepID=UPI002677218D|nr:type I pullulanase [uncultured Duncaniella sp.]MCI9172298.1 type I pullulanase [Muribaculaceae bacterium]